MWIVCAPVALVGSAFWEADRQSDIKRKKKAAKDRELFYKYGGWGYWY